MGRLTARTRQTRLRAGNAPRDTTDLVAVEEPLELRAGGSVLTVTMRTPGHDIELAHGWLLSEGIIAGRDDVAQARYCAGSVVDDDSGAPQNTYNVLELQLAPGVDPGEGRRSWTTSACGVCGVDSLAALARPELTARADAQRAAPGAVQPSIDLDVLLTLPAQLRQTQKVFARTGGTHAAGLFGLDGTLLVAREDVGRHNAVDKVLGWALLQDRLPLQESVLVVSSRVSYELILKAATAGVPIFAAVSAPSSLALQAAQSWGVCVAAFVRDAGCNVYTYRDRVHARGDEAGTPP